MKVAIFVDAANMFYAQRDNRWRIDYEKVLGYFSRGHELTNAYYFTGTPPYTDIEGIEKYRSFRRYLVRAGYTLIEREARKIVDRETGEEKLECDLDTEIVLQAVLTLPTYDMAIFMSGDGDLIPLIDHLRSASKIVKCVARKASTARELISRVNEFIDLNRIKRAIVRKEKKKGG